MNKEVEINRCEYFVTTLLKIDIESRIHVSAYDSFRIVIVTQGQGSLVDNNGNGCQLHQGDVLLIPASTQWVDIKAKDGEAIEVVTTYVP